MNNMKINIRKFSSFPVKIFEGVPDGPSAEEIIKKFKLPKCPIIFVLGMNKIIIC